MRAPETAHSTWSPLASTRKPLAMKWSLAGRSLFDINMASTFSTLQQAGLFGALALGLFIGRAARALNLGVDLPVPEVERDGAGGARIGGGADHRAAGPRRDPGIAALQRPFGVGRDEQPLQPDQPVARPRQPLFEQRRSERADRAVEHAACRRHAPLQPAIKPRGGRDRRAGARRPAPD